MNKSEIIFFIISLILIISICIIFTFVFLKYYKNKNKDIANGIYDAELKNLDKNVSKNNLGRILSYIFLGVSLMALSFSTIFVLSSFNSKGAIIGEYGLIAITSASMEKRNPNNEYLYDNQISNQLKQYDLVGVSKVHSKDDLKLYDIIVFKNKNNNLIIHRIIDIKDDGYITQGDANSSPDTFKLYDEYLEFNKIVGKYNGFKLSGVGLIFIFLKSPIGILTIMSIIYCLLVFDTCERNYNKSLNVRLNKLINEKGGNE